MTTPLSVVFLNPIGREDWGGVETDMLALARGLPARGFTVAAAGRDGGRFLAELTAVGVPGLALSLRRDFGPRDGWRLRGLLRRRRADVIVTKLSKGLRLAVLARALGGRGAIVMQQGLYEFRRGFRHRVLYRKLARVMVPARAIRERVRAEGAFDVDRVDWVMNGVDAERFRPDPARGREFRARHGLPAGPLLVSTGRLHEQKAQDLMIRALRALPPDAVLALAGRGKLEPALRATAAAARVPERVRFFGHIEDVADLLRAADVFVLSSLDEGMPSSVLEAMAVGLPVVATDVGDLRLMLDDDRAGVVVPPGDEAAFAGAIADLLADPDRRARLGAAARARAIAEYPSERRLDGAERCFRLAVRQ